MTAHSLHTSVPAFTVPGEVYVAHVKKGYEDRERHIDEMMGRLGVSFTYMLDGDIPDITPERSAAYFSPQASFPMPARSCALKHLLIYEEIVRRRLYGALILEDDICLDRKFPEIFTLSMKELPAYERPQGTEAPMLPVMISYEDTRLRFVERSRRQKGRVLYPGDRDRMTGCYYVNRAAAEAMLHQVKTGGGISMPIDLFHAWMLREGKLSYLWCQPTVATQGSHNGLFRSGIYTAKTAWEERKWKFKLLYRKLLYFLR